MKPIIPFDEILPAFCALRCIAPSVYGNGGPIPANPRIVFLRKLFFDLELDYEMDMWTVPYNGRNELPHGGNILYFYNFYLKGTSNKMVTAHHDIVNPHIDNCNDNSASVINAIAAKVLNPELNVAITDCEEFGGRGAQRLSEKINEGYFGEIEFVLNLELTAVGGMNFFTEYFPNSVLYQKIQRLFPNTPTVRVPFHDGIIFRENKIDSVVINPLPLNSEGKLDMEYLSYCHTSKDTISLANYQDMDDFVRNVITPIVN